MLSLVLSVSETMFVTAGLMPWPHRGVASFPGARPAWEELHSCCRLLPRRLVSGPCGHLGLGRAVGRARAHPSSVARARAGRRSSRHVSASRPGRSVAPTSQPHIHLVLKALGPEQRVVGGYVGFSSVTTVPGRCGCRAHTVTGPGQCSALLTTFVTEYGVFNLYRIVRIFY